MRPQPQSDEGFLADTRRTFNVLHWIAEAMAFPVNVWTTRLGSWGRRFIGPWSAPGLLWPLVFATVYGPYPRIGWVTVFGIATWILVLLHQSRAARREREGDQGPSRSWGMSWFERRGSDLRGQERARGTATALAFLLGFFVFAALAKPLGALLLISSVAKGLCDSLVFRAARARVRAMTDARFEAAFYARRSRENFSDER